MVNTLRSRDIPVKFEPILMPFDSARRDESNEWSNFSKRSRGRRDLSFKLSSVAKSSFVILPNFYVSKVKHSPILRRPLCSQRPHYSWQLQLVPVLHWTKHSD